ncbi:MAG: hypothetical protein Unbinned4026contig1001_5 [Prokaryotic dsDNA virus sp.]|nr:MAG: hypothetical protein Unbinned4026contig1001_5 [Prokaryotic dsDNA virus sp.]|tara:strand:- start:17658 stop:18521 length:864 start_codon:yes stop_codon:yes gene_type:complete
MSTQLTDNAVAQFDSIVKHAYAEMGKIRQAVRVKSGVIGSTHRFPKMGKGQATQRVPQTDVVPMNIAHTSATATITDWIAAEYTDVFNQQKVNYDEKKLLAHVIAGGITRREDQLIIDALDASSTSLTVADTIGGNDGMNVTKLRRASRLLTQGGVPMTDRYFVHSSIALEQMLGVTPATSMDFNSVRALVNGEMNSYVGFEFICIEDRDEGGLPLATNNRTCFAFHGGAMGSIGLAVGIDFRTEVNYIPEKTSYLAAGLFAAGSIAIDDNGIVDVDVDESVAVDSE